MPEFFHDVLLGEHASDLVARRGEPMLVRAGTEPGEAGRDYFYLSSDGNVVEFLHLFHGNVVGVSARASPFAPAAKVAQALTLMGISLGDPASKVEALPSSKLVSVDFNEGDVNSTYRGDDGRLYTFTNSEGTVSLVSVYMNPETIKKLAPSPEPKLHDGTSVSDAIVLIAPTNAIRLQSEQAYFALHPCSGNGTWHTTLQTRGHKGHQQYDVIDASCSSDRSVRTFYFDVTRSREGRL